MTRKKILSLSFLSFFLFCGAAFQYGGLKLDITSRVSSVSPIILNTASTQILRVSGSANQVVKLPDATTLRAGYFYFIQNEGSGTLTIANSASTQITQLAAGNSVPKGAFVFLTSNGAASGPWTYALTGGSSGGGGGGSLAISTKTANYTMTDSDDVILCDTSSGAITITMHSAASASPKPYKVKVIGDSACTIDTSGGDSIDDDVDLILTVKNTAVDLIPDGGTVWRVF